jgi:hypothetical protein
MRIAFRGSILELQVKTAIEVNMSHSTPSHYSLLGHNVVIDYSLSDIAGKMSLNFKIDKHSGTVHGKDIHTTKIEKVGSVVTIPLHSGPSADDDPQFSFLVPDLTIDGDIEIAFDTVGFETILTRKGPAHQRYTSVALKGKAASVQTLAANG